jgi:hypothetical protein
MNGRLSGFRENPDEIPALKGHGFHHRLGNDFSL